MIIDIPVKKHNTYDCFQENIVAPICYYWNRDIQPAFFKLFDFNFDTELLAGKTLFESKCVSPYSFSDTEEGNNIDTLLLYSGLHTSFYSVKDKNEYENMIKSRILSKKPVGIEIDSIYLPWNEYYNKLNREHFLLIVGINDSDEYMCYDANISKQMEKMPKDAVLPYIDKLVLCENFEPYMTIENSVIVSMLNNKSLLEYKDKFTQMHHFGSYLENYNISTEELKKFKDINLSPLFYMIICLGWCRINYLHSLVYISEKCNIKIFDDLIGGLEMIERKWENIKSLLIKGFMKNRDVDFLKYVGNVIKTLSVDECSFVEKIYDIAGDYL